MGTDRVPEQGTASLSRRPGRPRSRRQGPDRGTPEAQAKRIALVGSADTALAESPLGTMLARRLIGEAQHEAAESYATLYRQVLGVSTAPRAVRLDGSAPPASRGDVPLDVAAERSAALRRLSRLVSQATKNVAVFGVWPRFLLSTRWDDFDAATLLQIQADLAALVAAMQEPHR